MMGVVFDDLLRDELLLEARDGLLAMTEVKIRKVNP
jgi:hypothetical protein